MRRAAIFAVIALAVTGATGASGPRQTAPIVFLSNWVPHFRTSEIFTVPVRGGRPRDLTKNELEDVDPSWSPDGGRIVFARRRHRYFALYLMRANGRDARLLLARAGDLRQPAWSPDGKRIAFVGRGSDANEKGWRPDQLFVMNADGSGVRQVTHDENGAADPAWAPDGAKLAGTDGSIFTVDANGAGFRSFEPVVETDGDAHPSWSPDGRRLVFDRKEVETTTSDLWLMNADGTDQRLLARFGGQPAWSPDGHRVAFVNGDVWSCDKEGCFEEGRSAVATIGVAGGRRHYVTRPLQRLGQSFGAPEKWLFSSGATYFGLHWSPNGRKLLYARRFEQRAPDLFAIAGPTQRPRRLAATREVEASPVVSPDGRRVMFERYPLGGGAPGVFVMPVAGGRAHRLAFHGYSGAWSPDGRRVTYVGNAVVGGGTQPTRIYVADRDGAERRRLVDGGEPTWSPDGLRLAFVQASKRGLVAGDAISVVNADGSARRRLLTLPRRSLYGLTWSPTSRWIAFVNATRAGTAANLIELVNADTGERRSVTGTRFWEGIPAWSPDGRRLAFERRKNPSSAFVAVVVTRADGRGAHRLGKWSWREISPSWSPNGSRIAVASMRSGNYRITTVRPDGAGRRTLTRNLADNIEPSW